MIREQPATGKSRAFRTGSEVTMDTRVRWIGKKDHRE